MEQKKCAPPRCAWLLKGQVRDDEEPNLHFPGTTTAASDPLHSSSPVWLGGMDRQGSGGTGGERGVLEGREKSGQSVGRTDEIGLGDRLGSWSITWPSGILCALLVAEIFLLLRRIILFVLWLDRLLNELLWLLQRLQELEEVHVLEADILPWPGVKGVPAGTPARPTHASNPLRHLSVGRSVSLTSGPVPSPMGGETAATLFPPLDLEPASTRAKLGGRKVQHEEN